MTQEQKGPKKGAARKWSQRLKELAQRPPPKGLLEKIKKKDQERAAKNLNSNTEAEV